MDYKAAIEAVRQGQKVTREAWLEPGGLVQGGKTRALMLVSGAEAPYCGIGRIAIDPFVVQYTIAGTIHVYDPTPADKAAKDWKIFEAD